MTETPTGWRLLHAKLPSGALKELATSVYGVAGLTDVNEGYLIQRLFASGLRWEWRIRKQEYLGFEDKTSQGGKDYRVYMAAVHGRLQILDEHDWRVFDGSGASDNRKLDAAYKGAATVAFKNACKLAGMTAELYLDGRAIDHIYSERVLKDQTMVPERRVEEIVAWAQQAQEATDSAPKEKAVPPPAPAEGAFGSDQRQGSGDASPRDGAASVERPDGAVTQAPPPPDPKTGELDLQPLFDLGRTLPKDPLTALEIQAVVAAKGYAGARTRLLLDHARQCGKSPCEHVAVAAGLKVAK